MATNMSAHGWAEGTADVHAQTGSRLSATAWGEGAAGTKTRPTPRLVNPAATLPLQGFVPENGQTDPW